MQKLTDDQLNEAERLGALMFSTAEICLILGLVVEDYCCDEALMTARSRGKLKKEAEVRNSIFELAISGSAPAQTLAKQFMDQARVFSAGA